MDINRIKHLLTKYFEGNTSLEEENVLQVYFSQEHEVDADLVALKKHFMLLKSGKDFKLDISRLELNLVKQIDGHEIIYPHSRGIQFRRLLIAASVALMIGMGGILFYQIKKYHTKDTFTDPQLAYLETQKALLYVSQKMNKGIEPLSNISKINTGADKLKSLEKMDQSLGMLNLVSFINRSSNLKK